MPEHQNSKFVINNCLKEISAFPNSIKSNDLTIYEVVRLINKKILFLDDHIQRFFNSFEFIGIKLKLTRSEILNQLKLLVDSNQIFNGNIKFQVIISSEKNHQDFYAYFIPHSYPSAEQYVNGVPVSIVHALRSNPNAKVQQTELRQKVDQILTEEKTYEAILVNPEDMVTEGSRSNLFMIKNNEIFTAQNKDILPGITRKYILQVCEEQNIQIFTNQISLTQLLTMDALFITGTSPKVLPINSVYTNKFDVQHSLLRKIMKEFDEVIKKDLQLNSIFCE